MSVQGGRLCYWPGRHRRADELFTMMHLLARAGWRADRLEPVYDHGPPPGHPRYPLPPEIRTDPGGAARWWIGLSLGGAVASIVAAYVDRTLRPDRLTLINPFADRADLARRRGFAVPPDWDLAPVSHRIPREVAIDLVRSARDEKIPLTHFDLLREAFAPVKPRIIVIDADHSISEINAQRRLAGLLLRERR